MIDIHTARDTLLSKKTVQTSYTLTCGTTTISSFITRTLSNHSCEVASRGTRLVIVDAPNMHYTGTVTLFGKLDRKTELRTMRVTIPDATC